MPTCPNPTCRKEFVLSADQISCNECGDPILQPLGVLISEEHTDVAISSALSAAMDGVGGVSGGSIGGGVDDNYRLTPKNYEVQLRYPVSFPFAPPRVVVISPKIPMNRRIHEDGHLLLFHEDIDIAWQPRTAAATVMNWASLWLHCYDVWKETGNWPGTEEEPPSPGSGPTVAMVEAQPAEAVSNPRKRKQRRQWHIVRPSLMRREQQAMRRTFPNMEMEVISSGDAIWQGTITTWARSD